MERSGEGSAGGGRGRARGRARGLEAGGAATKWAPGGGPVLERAEGDPMPSCHLAQGAQFLHPSARQLSFDIASPRSKYRNLMENGSPMVSHCV